MKNLKKKGKKKSPEERLGLVRQKLMKKYEKSKIEENMVNETLGVAQSMGWTIDYTMELGIDAYNYTINYLVAQTEQYKGEGKEIRTLG